ncbi:uncharacterized protein NPIL_600381 [Nephila pilipes]|nr:uncharacterized protein NPIL_600381 [Nephila pilipes]
MSRIKLELSTDLGMHLFIERGIRGGISMISHRFSSANNKYLESYDEVKPSKYILYLDANNLYGWAMSQFLPTHSFNKYDTNAKLLFTDTDSLCYEISTSDVYKDMEKDLHLFDTPDYPKNHVLHNETNKKVLGKMKDELSSSLAVELVGLNPKMYSLKSVVMEKKKQRKEYRK